MMKKVLLFVSLLCLLAGSSAWAKIPDAPLGRISDFAEMLTEDEEASLQSLVDRVEKTNRAQMAVVTVSSLDGLTIDDYANRLYKQWGIGRKGKDDGVLLLVSLDDLKARVEVGYGLEGVLNDSKIGRILDEAVMPKLKARDFGPALQGGLEQMATAIVGDAALTAPAPAKEEPIPTWLKIAFPLFLGFFVTMGFVSFGAGFRGDWKLVVWGTLFGGIPLGMSILAAPAMGYPEYLLPAWAFLMFLIGILFCKKYLARYGGPWGVKIRVGFGGGSSSGGSGSRGGGGGFGGGSSGGGGASR
jgi:uncharacterized protein